MQGQLQDCEAGSPRAVVDEGLEQLTMFGRFRAGCARLLLGHRLPSAEECTIISPADLGCVTRSEHMAEPTSVATEDALAEVNGRRPQQARKAAEVPDQARKAAEVPDQSTSASDDVFNLFEASDIHFDGGGQNSLVQPSSRAHTAENIHEQVPSETQR